MKAGSILTDKRVQRAWQSVNNLAQQNPQPGSIHLVKNSLNGGELAPELGGRFDQQRWQTGLHQLLNMIPLPCGGITKRPGLNFLGWSLEESDGYAGRLIPFIFSQSQSRMLEFVETASGAAMRVWTPAGTCLGQKLTLPWLRGALDSLSYCQSADVIFLASPYFAPAKIMRYGDNDWRYSRIVWTPQIAKPQITAITTEGENSGSLIHFYYVATAIDGETGQESLPSAAAHIQTEALTQSHNIVLTIGAVAGASEYRVYKKRSGVYGFVGRIDPAQGLQFTDSNIEPDTEDTPPSYRDPFQDNYPSVVFMHQQRLGFAGSTKNPLTVWLSQAGNFESMASSLPPRDDDAIEATLAAPEANRILWAQSDRSGLAIGTEGGEWLLTSSEGAALTPSDLSFQPQTYYGSEPGHPVLRSGASLLYLQAGGQAVREFGYSFTEDRYQSTDVSLLARHLLRDNPIIAWAWQPEPYGIIWCCLYDGTLAGLTYLREQDVIAWHRHKTAGFIETVAAMPGPGGAWQLWAMTFRTKSDGADSRAIERLADFYEGGPSLPTHQDGPYNKTFQARAIPCLPEFQNEAGQSLGLAKKINAINCRVINSKPIKCRVLSQDTGPGPIQNLPARGTNFTPEADWSCPTQGGWRNGAKLELILDGPDPATILAITTSLEAADSIINRA